MNRYFSLSFFLAALLACNNQSAETKTAATDTAAAKMQPDTAVARVDSSAKTITTPTELTADEMKDDSVFSDGSKPTSWANAGIDDPVAFKKTLKQLQYWAANNEKDSIANLLAYPLAHPRIKNKKAFLDNYDQLFNEKVKKALKEQKLNQIFRNDQGAMIGNGALWFSKWKGVYKIFSINN